VTCLLVVPGADDQGVGEKWKRELVPRELGKSPGQGPEGVDFLSGGLVRELSAHLHCNFPWSVWVNGDETVTPFLFRARSVRDGSENNLSISFVTASSTIGSTCPVDVTGDATR